MSTAAPLKQSTLPLGVQADGTLTRKATPIAFVVGTLAVFAFLPLGVLGIILNNMGLERVATAPGSARKLITWSWWILGGVDIVAVVAVIVLLLVM